jgi:hypothetical protein
MLRGVIGSNFACGSDNGRLYSGNFRQLCSPTESEVAETPFYVNLVSARKPHLIDTGLTVLHSADADLRQGHRCPIRIPAMWSGSSLHECRL